MSYRVIDADGHVEEDLPALYERVDPQYRDHAPQFEMQEDGSLVSVIGGKRREHEHKPPRGEQTHTSAGGQYNLGGKDARTRLEVMDSEGIWAAVIYPSTGLIFGMIEDIDAGIAFARAYNDWLADWCSAAPNRLVGIGLLPQQDPAAAVEELRRCVEELGFVGGMLRPNRMSGRTADDPGWEPLWVAAEQLDVPIVFHEGYLGGGVDTIGADRASSYVAAHVMCHPFEQMAAMLGLLLNGTIQNHPGLRLGFFESGCGWAPYWAERIEEHYELGPDDFRGGDPHHVLNTRTWISFEVEEPGLPFAAAEGWADNMCFASDYPHFDAVFPGAVKTVLDRNLGPELERKILSENALRFYGDRLRRLVEREG